VQQQGNKIILSVKNAKLLTRTYKNLFYKDSRVVKTNIIRKKQFVQIFFTTNKKYKIKSFFLKPNNKYKYHRLVIDIIGIGIIKTNNATKKLDKKINAKQIKKNIIVIDPGHGGEDSGARGKKSYEKNIVLAIAKKLQKLINKSDKFSAVLSRKGDYFINLSKRPRIAQVKNAKAFISIHADSAIRKSASGASVYVLSKKGGVTKLAKKLEKSENANDIFDNNSIKKDWVLKTIMRDLARDNKKSESLKLANSILNNLKKIGKLHKKQPQKANFVVLKTPAIPSVLVETSFISNPSEEKKLNSDSHQQQIANAIYSGIMGYFNN